MMEYIPIKIAVDFDGTCVDHRYPEVGDDAPNCVEVLKALADRGDRLFLYTMRSGNTLADAVSWFVGHGIPLSGVNSDPAQSEWTHSPKCFANRYVDDAAVGCPLIEIDGFERPVVDWEVIARWLGVDL